MAAAVTAIQHGIAARFEQGQGRYDRRPCAPVARPNGSLAELLERTHAQLRTNGQAPCPMCGGPMERTALEGGCGQCGSRLA